MRRKELGKYVSSAHELRLSNGSVIHFCHLSNEGEGLLKYQGAEIHWLYFDELTHFTKPMYDYLRTRLRAEKRLGITPCVRCASNPGGPGHAWVKARFVDATGAGQRVAETTVESSVLGEVSVRRIEYIPATAMDNPHVTRDYIIELEQKPKALREALLLGKWDAFDGQAFPEFADNPAHYEDGCTRTLSNRSKFHGTGRGWSVSTTDTRGLFLLAFGRWTKRGGSTGTRSFTAACRGKRTSA